MSTALSGPTSYLGVEMKLGVEIAFDEVNQSGGIHGMKVKLICLDDGYEPKRTIPNMYRLINDNKVLAIIGNVGTPTAVAAIPIAEKYQTLFLGAYTGAGVLRKKPPSRYVINYRASYAEETNEMIENLLHEGNLLPEEIAFFTQRDTYGDAGYSGGIVALKNHGLKSEWKIAHARYERNTLAVENAVADLLLHPITPKAVIMFGTYAPCAKFVRLAKENGLNALFLNCSFVGTEQFLAEAGPHGEGTVIAQAVPHYESDIPVAREFREALDDYHKDVNPSYVSFEGYIVARMFLIGLQKAYPVVDRMSIIDVLESLGEFDIGLDFPLFLNRDDHQASHRVLGTMIRDGKIQPFLWSSFHNMIGHPFE